MILLVFLLTAIVGAAGPPLIKYLVIQTSPLGALVLRSLLSAIFLSPFVIKHMSSSLKGSKDLKLLFIANFLFGINWFFAMEGFRHTSILMNQIIYALVPILVGLLGYFFLKEKVKKHQLAGLVLSLVGMGILIHASLEKVDIVSFGTPFGNIITAMGLISWSLYIVLTRKISTKFNPQTILFSNFVTTFVLSVPVVLLLNLTSYSISLPQLTNRNILLWLGLGIFSVVFFYLYQWLIKNASIFTSSLINYTGPIASAVTGPLFFKERISQNYIVGAFLIVLGIFLSTTFDYYQTRRK